MTGRPSVPADVGVVRARFESWRKAKKGRCRIPEPLWSAAAGLCRRHGVNLVSQWLRVNHTALRDRVRTATRGKEEKATPAFVEVSAPVRGLFPPSPVGLTAEYVVELDTIPGQGLRVRARGAGVAEVAELARLLRDRVR